MCQYLTVLHKTSQNINSTNVILVSALILNASVFICLFKVFVGHKTNPWAGCWVLDS